MIKIIYLLQLHVQQVLRVIYLNNSECLSVLKFIKRVLTVDFQVAVGYPYCSLSIGDIADTGDEFI